MRRKRAEKSSVAVLPTAASASTLRRSARPQASSRERRPRAASHSRVSRATKERKLTMYSGLPEKHLRRSGSCVATPAGQVLAWHCRIMTHPRQTKMVVAKPNSCAPSKAPMTTSRPVLSWPSTCRRTRRRRRLSVKVWCVSASPSSQGRPAWWMEERGEAPVPPSCPATRMTSAWALATPAATVPMPASETSLTETRASGFTVRRSWMSWAKSSME